MKGYITTKQILSQLCNPHHLMYELLILVIDGVENPFTINGFLFSIAKVLTLSNSTFRFAHYFYCNN